MASEACVTEAFQTEASGTEASETVTPSLERAEADSPETVSFGTLACQTKPSEACKPCETAAGEAHMPEVAAADPAAQAAASAAEAHQQQMVRVVALARRASRSACWTTLGVMAGAWVRLEVAL